MLRLNKVLRELNISLKEASSILKGREKLGSYVNSLSFKLNQEQYKVLKDYVNERIDKMDNSKDYQFNKPEIRLKIVGKIDLDKMNLKTRPDKERKQYRKKNIVNKGKIEDKTEHSKNVKTTDTGDEESCKDIERNTNRNALSPNINILKLEVKTSCLYFRKNEISLDYNGLFLKSYVNGISGMLNNYLSEICNEFPYIKVKVEFNLRRFVLINPKFYIYLTDLCSRIKKEKGLDKKITQKKRKSKEREIIEKTSDKIKIKTVYKKTQILTVDNIEFFDNHYKIWVLDKNKVRDRNISPFIIRDNFSHACFNILNKYFKDRLPSNVIIVYSKNRIVSVEEQFKLDVYIKILNNSLSIHGDWDYELKNYTKPTLKDCVSKYSKIIKKEISYKSIFIDYLASNQSEKQLIKAYEAFNGLEEDCFIFAIKMHEDLYAIVYENVSFARATEVFVIQENNYESAVNLIFNYFTDYELKNKRLAIKHKHIEPELFKSINYYSIDHDNISIWIKKINNILKDCSEEKQNIQFKPGLRISKETNFTESHLGKTNITHVHNSLMKNLYDKLSHIYGAENVGTEIRTGDKRIDSVVRNKELFDIYEIKSESDVRMCIRQGMGQILDYAFFECPDQIGKLVIIGPSPVTDEANQYLRKMRELHNINIYYETV